MRNTTTIQSDYHLIFRHLFSVCLACLSVLLIYTLSHAAGINTDGSMGPATTLTGPNYTIPPELGQQKGSNLFHSFGYFNVRNGEKATFTTDPRYTTNNIIGRVTGGEQSEIYGSLTCKTAGANLWLLNPAGILFGAGSSLDVQGSFHASTADSLQLSDGGVFYTDPSKNSKLTVAAPSAFGFLNSKPKEITISGSNLTVKSGKTLSLIGGDINIVNGLLFAPSGKINLISLASPGVVILNNDGITFEGSPEFGDIQISTTDKALQDSRIVVSGLNDKRTNSGGVDIYCSNLDLFQSYIEARSYGDSDDSGEVRIFAEKNVSISNSNIIAESHGEGKGGNIQINADELRVMNNSSVINESINGNTGDIHIIANLVHIGETNTDGIHSNRISLRIFSGNCGSLEIKTDKLKIEGNGAVAVSTMPGSTGNGGNFKITANTIELGGLCRDSNGTSGIWTDTQGGGRGTDLIIDTNQLTLSNGAVILSGTHGSGDSGDIAIHATNIKVDGMGLDSDGSVIYATNISAISDSTGKAGYVHLHAKTVSLTNGAKIYAYTKGKGKGGTIDIIAENVLIDGRFTRKNGESYFSQINSRSYGDGSAGSITVKTSTLKISDSGGISTSSSSIGIAGSIDIQTKSLKMNSGASISSASTGTGDAGSIVIAANDSMLLNDASITVEASKASAGDIKIQTPNLDITNASQITASVSGGSGSGGGIDLNVDTLSITEGSRIESNTAGSGSGGNITVAAGTSVTISGKTEETSGMYSKSKGAGSAGSITVKTPTLNISDSGEINTSSSSIGTAGSIDIQTKSLEMNSGASISSASNGTGDAGSIMIAAKDSMLLNDAAITVEANSASAGDIKIQTPNLDMTNTSQITASVSGGSGSGGLINLNVDTLSITEGSRVESNTAGSGPGGNITVAAGSSVTISGKTEEASGMYSTSTGASSAGSINVKTPTLKIFDSGEISSSASGTGSGGSIDINVANLTMTSGAVISSASTGTGDAGNINLTVANKLEIRNSTITTESMLADGGDITITTDFLTWLIDSSITAAVGGGTQTTGGNIRINSPYIVLKDSQIITNAYEGKGGRISITADTYLADWTSTVSASSTLGISGQVDINSPLVNLSGLLSPLPTVLVDIFELLVDDCETRYKNRKVSSLVVRGRGALPAQPGDLWPSPVMMQ